ncbi:MAG: hypothetical protein FJ288_10985 [Planctomycetes bacterium]|nr:hypothetical protein [Planctomycetota bacterium]
MNCARRGSVRRPFWASATRRSCISGSERAGAGGACAAVAGAAAGAAAGAVPGGRGGAPGDGAGAGRDAAAATAAAIAASRTIENTGAAFPLRIMPVPFPAARPHATCAPGPRATNANVTMAGRTCQRERRGVSCSRAPAVQSGTASRARCRGRTPGWCGRN